MELPDRPGQRHEIFVPPDLPGTIVLDVERSDHIFKVFHETYTAGVIFGGEADWKYRGRDHFTGPGHVMLMQPGETHVTRKLHTPGTYTVFMFEPESIARAAVERGSRKPDFRVATTPDPSVYRTFVRLTQTALDPEAPRLARETAREAALDALFACAGSFPPPALRSDASTVKPAVDYLVESCDRTVTLGELAAVVRRAPAYVARAFARSVGEAPHRFQMRVRVTKAKRLIDRGLSAKEASHAVGFSSPAQLTRWFARVWGMTPSQYAKSVRGLT